MSLSHLPDLLSNAFDDLAHWLDRRSACPWDREPRRASHADKRKAIQRVVLRAEIHEALAGRPTRQRIHELGRRLLALAA
jgi:hypothetical protein